MSDNIQNKAGEILEDLKDKAGDVAEGFHAQTDNLADKIGDVAEGVIGKDNAEKVEQILTSDVGAIAGGLFGKLKDAAGGLVDKAKDVVDGDK